MKKHCEHAEAVSDGIAVPDTDVGAAVTVDAVITSVRFSSVGEFATLFLIGCCHEDTVRTGAAIAMPSQTPGRMSYRRNETHRLRLREPDGGR